MIMEDCGPILTDCTLIKTLEQAGPQLFWEMSLSRCTLFRTLFRVPPFSEMLFFLLMSESTNNTSYLIQCSRFTGVQLHILLIIMTN